MRKFVVGGLYVGVLLTSCLVPFSCKEEEPFVKPNLSFALKTLTVNEADDIIEVEVILDKAFTEDITIEYSLSGDAVEKVDAGSTSSYDYEIISDYLEVEILEGETVGKIEIQLYSDLDVEDDEIIDIQIESVDNEQIEITRDDRLQITVEQEDGIAVVLEWGVGEAPADYADVDMDLFFWAPSTTTANLVITNINSFYSSPEIIFLPNAILPDGTYGLSYNYYSGTKEPMNFQVTFAELLSGVFESAPNRNIFEATYTLANINAWDEDGAPSPVLAQTFKKTGTTYSDFLDPINIEATGSRSTTNQIPETVRKVGLNKSYSETMKSLLNR